MVNVSMKDLNADVTKLRDWRRRQSIVLPDPTQFARARSGVPEELRHDLVEAERRGQYVNPMFRSAVQGGIECASTGGSVDFIPPAA